MRVVQHMEIIGELESEVLNALQSRGSASTAEIVADLQRKREIAYTTVSTTLDRLYRKNLVKRKAVRGPGGTKFIFEPSKDDRPKIKIIKSAIDRLTSAFGETTYSALYKIMDDLPDNELEKLKKRVEGARKRQLC